MQRSQLSLYAKAHPHFRELRVVEYEHGTLELKEHCLEFAQSSLDWVRDSDVNQYMGADFAQVSPQTEVERIREILADENAYNWVILLDGKAIGAISIGDIREKSEEYTCKAGNLVFLIGYPQHRQKGIASAVIRSVLVWGFQEAGFAMIVARALEQNIASRKTLKSLGFEECGTEPYDGLVHGKPSQWKKYQLIGARTGLCKKNKI